MIKKDSINKPAPRWFRITRKVIANLSTFVLAILVIINKTDEKTMLIIKLCESFVLEQLDTFMSNGEVYAKPETVEVTATITKTDTTKTD